MYNLIKNQKIRSFCYSFLLALCLIIVGSNLRINQVAANNLVRHVSTENIEINLEEQGKQAYNLGNYKKAKQIWQKALIKAQNNHNLLAQARIISNLALTYYQLGDTIQAKNKLQKSQEILKKCQQNTETSSVFAQIFNNQGIVELALGDANSAIAHWDLAITAYQKSQDDWGVIRAQLNQARAYKQLGLYERAADAFEQIQQNLVKQPDSPLKAVGFRSYGDMLRLLGKIDESTQALQSSWQIASDLSLTIEQIKTLLALGNTLSVYGDVENYNQSFYAEALDKYETGIRLCQSTVNCADSDLLLLLRLAKLNLFKKIGSWTEASDLIPVIREQLPSVANSKKQIELKINFAHNLKEFRQNTPQIKHLIPKYSEIIALLDEAIADAQKWHYAKAESYGWGVKGHVQEITADWEQASYATRQALQISQMLNASEVSYLWEWQLGRIDRARQKKDLAITHYLQALSLLASVSHDIANIDNTIQSSFKNSVEPVYREAVALLLDKSPEETISEVNLIQARDILESLQVAELNNFFRQACIRGQFVPIDAVDDHAAAVYPIIQSDRLSLILSLPHQPLQYYSVPISQTEVETTIEELQKTVVIRSRRNFYQPASQLYSWLIAPINEQLSKHKIQTLVFIPDGALRSVPLAALYDGKNYLIEQYNLVINPGLQLLNPRPLPEAKLQTLAVGLSQEIGNFTPLQYVDLELAKIQNIVKSEILMNEEFTTPAFEEEVKYSQYPIVHIATHGQFSSSLQDTFLLAWDGRINIYQLRDILQARTEEKRKAIELLVLSACETATGDNQAVLGLAGMAIQAGARSTIATLWSINDQATAELMNHLYQKIVTRTIGKAEAIREAQLSLLHDPQYKHPFYWAAYTTIGNWL